MRQAIDLSEVRRRAWETRRSKYGQRGHASSYSRPSRSDDAAHRALKLVLRLHREGTLSEGQCCKALDLDRITFRRMVDEL